MSSLKTMRLRASRRLIPALFVYRLGRLIKIKKDGFDSRTGLQNLNPLTIFCSFVVNLGPPHRFQTS